MAPPIKLSIAQQIAGAKDSFDRNYFGVNTYGVAELIQMRQIIGGFNGDSILAHFRIVESSGIDGATAQKENERVGFSIPLYGNGKAKEMAFINAKAMVRAILNVTRNASDAEMSEAIELLLNETQLGRGFQVAFKVPPSKNDPAKGYPKFSPVINAVEVNAEAKVAARRTALDTMYPLE